MRSIDELRNRFMPPLEPAQPEPGPAIMPDHDAVIDLRWRVHEMDVTTRRFAEVDLPKQVAWIERRLNAADGGWAFVQSHPDLRGLFTRMVLRCQAHDDAASEARLIKLAIAFKGVLR